MKAFTGVARRNRADHLRVLQDRIDRLHRALCETQTNTNRRRQLKFSKRLFEGVLAGVHCGLTSQLSPPIRTWIGGAPKFDLKKEEAQKFGDRYSSTRGALNWLPFDRDVNATSARAIDGRVACSQTTEIRTLDHTKSTQSRRETQAREASQLRG
jgi:hypothetical protein